MADHPTVGVEEEFLLVDQDAGAPVALNREIARRCGKQDDQPERRQTDGVRKRKPVLEHDVFP